MAPVDRAGTRRRLHVRNTRLNVRFGVEKAREPRWGDVRMDAVKASEVQAWLLDLTHSSAHMSLVVLRKIADFAVKRDLLRSNSFSISYDLPKKAGGRSKAILTLDEADALFDALRGSVVEAPFIAACFGSCRTGESLGIRVDEVERVDAHGIVLAVARVERQMPNSGYETTDMLKTDASRRIIVIPDKWGERFLEIADERRAVDSGGWLIVATDCRLTRSRSGTIGASTRLRTCRSRICGTHGERSRKQIGAWTTTCSKRSWGTGSKE